jgi:glyceraldehyde 3-phosphate dehydrogenase
VAVRIAINGFGRIGRAVFRILAERKDIEVVAVNDIAEINAMAHLLKYDTVMGRFPGEVKIDGKTLIAGRQKTQMLAVADPAQLPWKACEIDIVVESTGRFTKRAALEPQLAAGAKRIILTVPAKDEIDNTIVVGVNHQTLKSEHRIVSNASCTTNCLAPVAKVLHERFGIVKGMMTTIHAYTNDQRLADVPHTDFRRARAAAENIIPTTTGAARAVGKVLPELKGKLDGLAIRVPVVDGSIVDLVTLMEKDVTVESVNAAIREAAAGPMKSIIEYTEDPIVSRDVIGNSHSAVYDALGTQVIGGNLLKTLTWYDNEWGYSCRVVDLIELMAKL